jgi:endo-1,4-beta-xylanase
MITRRQLLVAAAAIGAQPFLPNGIGAEEFGALKTAALERGIEVGAMVPRAQLWRPEFAAMMKQHFTLAGLLFDEMEWGANPGYFGEPEFHGMIDWLDICAGLGLNVRARQIYSQENRPRSIHLGPDGKLKSKSELEKTLLKRVAEVCKPLKGRKAIIQVIDEILANNEGGLRKDPFADALGEEYVDLLFHAAHEAAPDALLIYQEFGPEIEPDGYFRRKTRDYLALLERLRKRNVPITGAALGGWFFPPAGQPILKRSVFQKIQDLDYDIHLTEMTVVYDLCGNPRKWKPPRNTRQHDRVVEQAYEKTAAFLAQFKRLKEITFWAPVDDDNTLETGTLCLKPFEDARPGIFNKDLTPKPVYHSVAKAIARSKPN